MVDQLNDYFYNVNPLSSIIRLPQPWIFIANSLVHYWARRAQNAIGYNSSQNVNMAINIGSNLVIDLPLGKFF